MSSANKTPKANLSQFAGTEHLKRADYNADMLNISNAFAEVTEPITPGIEGSVISFSTTSKLKKIPLKITQIVTGSISIIRNGAAAKPLKLPTGEVVTELSNEVMFYDIYEDAEAFIYAPKSGGLQPIDKDSVPLLTLPSTLANYIAKLIDNPNGTVQTVPDDSYIHGRLDAYIDTVREASAYYDSLTDTIFVMATNNSGDRHYFFEYDQVNKTLLHRGSQLGTAYGFAWLVSGTNRIRMYHGNLLMCGYNNGTGHSRVALINPKNGALVAAADAPTGGSISGVVSFDDTGDNIWFTTGNNTRFKVSVSATSVSLSNYGAGYSNNDKGLIYYGGYTYGCYNGNITKYSGANYSKGMGYTSASCFKFVNGKLWALGWEGTHFLRIYDTNLNLIKEVKDPIVTHSREIYANDRIIVDGVDVYIMLQQFFIKLDQSGNIVFIKVFDGKTPLTFGGTYYNSTMKKVFHGADASYLPKTSAFYFTHFQMKDLVGYYPKIDEGKILLLNTSGTKEIRVSESDDQSNFKVFKSGDKLKWNPTNTLIHKDDVGLFEKYLKVK